MPNKVDPKNGTETEAKHRKAAFKAWKTIHKRKIEKLLKEYKRIDQFVSPKFVSSLVHPEMRSQKTQLTLDGKLREHKQKKKYSGIIVSFEKTPSSICCGRFWELRWAFGCPLDCAYCYLRGTYRGKMGPFYISTSIVLGALEQVFTDPDFNEGKPAIFNSGELADSLMNPNIMEPIVDKFEESGNLKNHRILLLSKCGVRNVTFLTKKARRNTICAWSINAPEVAKKWELLAPHPCERLEAAKSVFDAGYEVRIRLDPIFPIDGWKSYYERIMDQLFSRIEPSRIILGTPRGLWKTMHYAEKMAVDISWADFLKGGEMTGWGLKLPFESRKEVYQTISDKLVSLGYDKTRITLCKETVEMWNTLGWKRKSGVCQCYSD